MSDKNIKLIRKQITNVVNDKLEGILNREMMEGIRKDLQKEMTEKLNNIHKEVEKSLSVMDDRSKEMQSYMIRQLLAQDSNKLPEGVDVNEQQENSDNQRPTRAIPAPRHGEIPDRGKEEV